MEHPLHIYNTLTRRKEQFVPLHEPFVGMYVCDQRFMEMRISDMRVRRLRLMSCFGI